MARGETELLLLSVMWVGAGESKGYGENAAGGAWSEGVVVTREDLVVAGFCGEDGEF